MNLKPKKWGDFQHYKDRCPPWIKLHRDLLNNRDFMRLPLASKALAPLLWLLASESKDGVFDASTDELVFRLRMSEKEIKEGLKALLDGGFFETASGVLASSEHVAIPETERETETKGEKKRPPKVEQTMDQFLADCKTAGIKPIPDDHAVRKYAQDAGIDNEMLQINWLIFRDRHVGQPKTYKDWPGAFANSVKSRWYGLWYIDGEEVKWTSTGLQEKKVIETRMKEANHG